MGLYGLSVCCMNCSFQEGDLIGSIGGFYLRRSGRLRESNVGDTGLRTSWVGVVAFPPILAVRFGVVAGLPEWERKFEEFNGAGGGGANLLAGIQ